MWLHRLNAERETERKLLLMCFVETKLNQDTQTILPILPFLKFNCVLTQLFGICMYITCLVYATVFCCHFFFIHGWVVTVPEYPSYAQTAVPVHWCMMLWWIPQRENIPKLLRGYLKDTYSLQPLFSGQCYLSFKRRYSAQQNTCVDILIAPGGSFPDHREAECGVCRTIRITMGSSHPVWVFHPEHTGGACSTKAILNRCNSAGQGKTIRKVCSLNIRLLVRKWREDNVEACYRESRMAE